MPASASLAPRASALGETVVVTLFASLYFAYVFRLPTPAFLSSGLGDWVDPYFINFLLEHWHRSLLRLADPSSPLMFFPAERTLGYSHGLILFVPFYSTARLLFDPFAAYNVMLLMVLVCGSASLFLFFRLGFRAPWFESMALTVFFFTSRNVVNGGTAVWTQRASVFLIPIILLLAAFAARMRDGRGKISVAFLVGLLVVLLFTQDFYTAVLSLLVTTLLMPGLLLLARRPLREWSIEIWQTAAVLEHSDPDASPRRPSVWWLWVVCVGLVWSLAILIHPIPRTIVLGIPISARDAFRPFLVAAISGTWFCLRIYRVFRYAHAHGKHTKALTSLIDSRVLELWNRQRRSFLWFAAGGAAGALVFLWIYLGSFLDHPSFPVEQVIESLRPVSVGGNRVDWSAVRHGYDSLRLVEWLTTVIAIASIPLIRIDERIKRSALWLLFLSLVVVLIPLRFNDFSLWMTFFAPIPGLSVIRDPKRIMPIYELAIVILAALAASRLRRPLFSRLAIGGLACVFLVTEWNPERFDYGRETTVFNRWVRPAIDVDPSCRSFFASRASGDYTARSPNQWALYSLDAMYIALDRSLPTLNGYSAWMPAGWALANPDSPEYLRDVGYWISIHGLQQVCQLDIEARTIVPVDRKMLR